MFVAQQQQQQLAAMARPGSAAANQINQVHVFPHLHIVIIDRHIGYCSSINHYPV